MASRLLPLRRTLLLLLKPPYSKPKPSSYHLLETSKALHSPLHSTPSRSFCSSHSLNPNVGPTAIDYSSILQEDEFHKLADSTIHDLQERFQEYGDSVQVDGFDIDYGNEVLTLKLGDLGTYVLNEQTPNRQIWLSSPVSGPFRFDWDRNAEAWIYRRTKIKLLTLLESEMEQLCGAPVQERKRYEVNRLFIVEDDGEAMLFKHDEHMGSTWPRGLVTHLCRVSLSYETNLERSSYTCNFNREALFGRGKQQWHMIELSRAFSAFGIVNELSLVHM